MYGRNLSGEPNNREDSALSKQASCRNGLHGVDHWPRDSPNIAATANAISWSLSPDGKALRQHFLMSLIREVELVSN